MVFIAISILSIEIKLIPIAVFSDFEKGIFCLIKIKVSKIILVIKPLMIASVIIPSTGNGIFVI